MFQSYQSHCSQDLITYLQYNFDAANKNNSLKACINSRRKKKSLIVTDIHIGFENTLASNEIFIGKNSTINETIQELLEIIDKEKPDSVILLGDVKSSIKSISRNEWDEVPMFLKKISEKCDVTLVPGNHDANIQKLAPDNISMISSTGVVAENILLTHGHTMPSENFSHVDKIIMGHIHPVFFQEDSDKWAKSLDINEDIKRKYFSKQIRRIGNYCNSII